MYNITVVCIIQFWSPSLCAHLTHNTASVLMPGILTDQPSEIEGKAPPPATAGSAADSEQQETDSSENSTTAAAAAIKTGGGEVESGEGRDEKGGCPFHRRSSSPESGEEQWLPR